MKSIPPFINVRNLFLSSSNKITGAGIRSDLRLSSIRVIGIVLSFALQVFFTKVIGVKEYGLYVLFTSWTNFLTIILILGYDRLIIKQLSYFYIQGRKGEFRTTLEKLIFHVSVNSLVFLLVAYFIPQELLTNSFFLPGLLRSTWLIIAGAAVLSTLFFLSGKILYATQRVELSSIRSEVLYKVIWFAAVMLLYFYFRAIAGINIIIIGVVVAYLLTLLIFVFIIDRKKILPYLSIKKKKVIVGKENYVFFFITFNYYIITQVDKIIIGKYESLETLGIYGLVSALINLISFSTIVYNSFLPKISNYIKSDNLSKLEKHFKITTRNSLIIALPFMMFLLVFTDDILLFFGEKFKAGTPILRVLICGQIAQFFSGPNSHLLINGRYAKMVLANSAVICVLTIVLNIACYKYYGVIGVAAVTSFGLALINIITVIEVKIFYKIFPYEFRNIILTLLVFISFYFIKVIDINVPNLIARLFVSFSLSLLTAILVIAMVFVLQRKKAGYNTTIF